MSVEDKTRHYYTLFRDLSPGDSPLASPLHRTGQEGGEDSVAEDKEDSVAEDKEDSREEDKEDSVAEAKEDSVAEDSLLEDDPSEDLEEGQVNIEEYDDDETTPHVDSEASKTQSPSSAGNISTHMEEDKIQIVIVDEKMEDNTEEMEKAAGDELEAKSGGTNSISSGLTADSPRRDQVLACPLALHHNTNAPKHQ